MKPAALEEVDVRAIVRLLGEVAALDGGHAAKKRLLMQGISDLVQADAWVWGLCVNLGTGGETMYTSVIHGGLTDEQFAKFVEATTHPQEATLTASMAAELRREGRHVTRVRAQIDPQDHLSRSVVYPIWLSAGILPGILSCRPLDATCLSTIGIYRQPEKPDFTERESRIAHIILTEVPWLHEQGWPEDRGVTVPRLSPRQRITLNLLLGGNSRSQIAGHMGISSHTANDYVKEVYRHFGVQSHPELMRRFMMSDGGDVPTTGV